LVSRSGGASATLRYDPLGRLYEVVSGETTRRFLYDGSGLVAEYNASGALQRRYVHGSGAGDDPRVWFEGSEVGDSARRNLYADERGSIVAVTDSAGAALSINTYDEYGLPGSANVGAFRYTGQVWLPELGMYYYKARMYSPMKSSSSEQSDKDKDKNKGYQLLRGGISGFAAAELAMKHWLRTGSHRLG
jgi:YD repeat-containing protein